MDSTPVYSCYAMGLFGGPIDTRWLPPVTGQNPPCPTTLSTAPLSIITSKRNMLDSHYDKPASLSPGRFVRFAPLNASSPAIWLVPGEDELPDA